MYVGIDLHSNQSTISVVKHDGTLVKTAKLENDPKLILEFLKICPVKTQVGIEATRNWHWQYDLLLGAGFHVKLGNPYQLSLNAKLKKKTDKLDATFIANALRVNMFPEVQAVTNYERQLLELLRARKSIVKQQTQVKNKIRSQLAKFNLRPPTSSAFTQEGLTWIREQVTDEISKQIIEHNLDLLSLLKEKIETLEKHINQFTKEDHIVKALQAEIPGVGIVIACYLRAVIADVRRFQSAKKLCAYVGIVPSTYESNGKVRHGHITRIGNSELRHMLVEAAHIAMRTNTDSRNIWEGIAKRRGSKIATCALSRKLLTKTYYVWKNQVRSN